MKRNNVKQITVRLTADEYAHVKQLSKDSGLKMEPAIRQLIMGVNLRPRPPDELPELLRQLCAPLGVEVVVLPMAQFEEKPVSSTRIRTALEGGDIPAANAMLGMPYAIRFTVHHGAGLGRTLGVPTINQIPPAEKLLPPFGVYVSEVKIEGKIYYGITNIGVKPTVQEKFTGVETNLFDCSEDLYGKQAEVSLLKFLRPEQKFASIDALKNQLDHDVAAGKKYVEKKFAQQ